MVDAEFPPGSLVRLVARPEVVGVVRGARSVGGAVCYDVFHGDRTHSYFASQLELVPAEPQTAPISGAALRAGLTSELLRTRTPPTCTRATPAASTMSPISTVRFSRSSRLNGRASWSPTTWASARRLRRA